MPYGPGESKTNIALSWYNARVSVVPIRADGTKRPTREWASLQQKPLSPEEVAWYWRPGEKVGVAAICGKISGNLEMLELEAAATDAASLSKIKEQCDLRAILPLWDSLTLEGYAEWTPSGGLHLLYRVPEHEIPGNTKLASTATGKTLAETRGEGGYVIVAPTNGLCHPSGEAWVTVAGKEGVIPDITWSQRQALHAALTAALDETPPPPPVTARREVAIRTGDDMRPGDVWEAKHDWDEPWFTNQGWQISHRAGGETFWVRPGKDIRDGHSATSGYNGQKDRLFVFSTSAGLPTEVPLTKFFVYSHYYFNGSMSEAAKSLRSEGYGTNVLVATPLRGLDFGSADTSTDVAVVLPPPPLRGIDLTDTGSGRKMKELYGDRFRYNTTEKCWYEWDGVRWLQDRKFSAEQAAEASAQKLVDQAAEQIKEAEATGDEQLIKDAKRQYGQALHGLNQGRIQAALARFAAQPGIAVQSTDFNCDNNLLNLTNGTLDLETLELHNNRPEDLLTLTLGAELDKDADCPMFDQFMIDAFPDVSVREYVQRALGYSLLGNPEQRAIFLLHGPSGTGKSVLTSVMSKVFGGYGVTAPASTFRQKAQADTLDLHRLRGARFVATSELPEGQLLDEDLVKRFTGGDLVMSRGHYQDFVEWKPNAVVWLATNYRPRINSDDNAIWVRAKSIFMGTQFIADGRKEIFGYADVLAREANGILNWLLAGLEAYRLRGLDEPDAVTQDVNNYRTEVNTVACFVRDLIDEEVLIRDGEGEIKSQILRDLFENYSRDNHQQALGARRYQNRLKALGFEPIKVGGVAMWKGLRLNPDAGVRGTMGQHGRW